MAVRMESNQVAQRPHHLVRVPLDEVDAGEAWDSHGRSAQAVLAADCRLGGDEGAPNKAGKNIGRIAGFVP